MCLAGKVTYYLWREARFFENVRHFTFLYQPTKMRSCGESQNEMLIAMCNLGRPRL